MGVPRGDVGPDDLSQASGVATGLHVQRMWDWHGTGPQRSGAEGPRPAVRDMEDHAGGRGPSGLLPAMWGVRGEDRVPGGEASLHSPLCGCGGAGLRRRSGAAGGREVGASRRRQ